MLKEKIVQKSPVLFSKHIVYEEQPAEGKKAYRTDELTVATVTIDGVVFDSDEKSMDRIDRIVTVAGWKFNQALAAGVSPSDAYTAVYSTEILWKTHDNAFPMVSIKTLCKVQESALNNMGDIWVKWG